MLYDAAAGLYLTKTRAYNPKTGRCLQRDILDEQGKDGVYQGFPFGADAIGTNLYAWCKNNPINAIDPSGLWWGWVKDKASSAYGWTKGKVSGAYNWSSEKVSGLWGWGKKKASDGWGWAKANAWGVAKGTVKGIATAVSWASNPAGQIGKVVVS